MDKCYFTNNLLKHNAPSIVITDNKQYVADFNPMD